MTQRFACSQKESGKNQTKGEGVAEAHLRSSCYMPELSFASSRDCSEDDRESKEGTEAHRPLRYGRIGIVMLRKISGWLGESKRMKQKAQAQSVAKTS